MRNFLMLFILAALLSACLEESEQVEQTLTKDQFGRLLAADGSKTWRLDSDGTADFRDCVDDQTYIFMKNNTDTGTVYITEPLFDCDNELREERDTLAIRRWTLTSGTSELFDGQLFLSDSEESFMTFEVPGINPESLILQAATGSESSVLRFEQAEEAQ